MDTHIILLIEAALILGGMVTFGVYEIRTVLRNRKS